MLLRNLDLDKPFPKPFPKPETRTLTLKHPSQVHAQVMLLRNLDLDGGKQLVNGSRGVITGFVDVREYMEKLRVQRIEVLAPDKATGRPRPDVGKQIQDIEKKIAALGRCISCQGFCFWASP